MVFPEGCMTVFLAHVWLEVVSGSSWWPSDVGGWLEGWRGKLWRTGGLHAAESDGVCFTCLIVCRVIPSHYRFCVYAVHYWPFSFIRGFPVVHGLLI